MEKSLAVIAIIVEDGAPIERVNQILSDFREYIIGRMGIPHRNGNNIISIGMEAPKEIINSLSGKLGMLQGVTSKAVFQKQ